MYAPAQAFADNHRPGLDVDERALNDDVKEAKDIRVPQAETAVGQRDADEILPVRAVNINAALIGIHPRPLVYALLQTFQPQNTGEYEIIFSRTSIPVNARIPSFFEDAARRRPGADFLSDAVDAGGRFEGVLPDALAKTGARGVVSPYNIVFPAYEERLRLDRLDEEKPFRVRQESLQLIVDTTQPGRFHGIPSKRALRPSSYLKGWSNVKNYRFVAKDGRFACEYYSQLPFTTCYFKSFLTRCSLLCQKYLQTQALPVWIGKAASAVILVYRFLARRAG
jgi:hypothetical protein